MNSTLPKLNKSQKGFTLVELLVVLGILVIILTLVLIAVNPSRQFSQANNVRRRADVVTILNSIGEYAADNNGDLPAGITSTATNMGSGTGDVDICADLVDRYIAEMPYDPTTGSFTSCSDYDTQYTIRTTGSNGRVIVEAPDAEISETIDVTR